MKLIFLGENMNDKKLFFFLVLLVVFHVVFVWTTSFRLGEDQQSIERLRNELENARANELVLERQLESVEQRLSEAGQTISDGRERVEKLSKLTKESAAQFTNGKSTIDGLRKSIKEAEEFYTNLEMELNSLRNELDHNNSDLEVK